MPTLTQSATAGIVELAGHYPMSFAAVQKHSAILERGGLVTKDRDGRREVVRTNLERLRVVRRLLDQYEQLWRGPHLVPHDRVLSRPGARLLGGAGDGRAAPTRLPRRLRER